MSYISDSHMEITLAPREQVQYLQTLIVVTPGAWKKATGM